MKTKQRMAYFLLLISLIMLVVPVIPHHHHADGLICMKNDITPDCCHQTTDESDHCCHDTGCLTTHYFQQPQQNNNEVSPDFLWVHTLFSEPILELLLLPEHATRQSDIVFRESLHGTQITRATGLRAPPLFASLAK